MTPAACAVSDMQALAAYVNFYQLASRPATNSGHAPAYTQPRSRADPKHGKLVYAPPVSTAQYERIRHARSPQALSLGYAVPPLWEPIVSTMAPAWQGLSRLRISFIPTCAWGRLSNRCCRTKAWDVAAYVELQARRINRLEHDFLRTCSISR